MASRGVNKVILVGNLGQDPEVRYMPNGGKAVANITLATSESWRDKQTGENKEITEWRTRKWQDQGGQDRYTTEVVVGQNGTMQMLGGRQGGSSGGQGGGNNNGWGAPQQPQQSGGSQPRSSAPAGSPDEPPMDFDDDIPF